MDMLDTCLSARYFENEDRTRTQGYDENSSARHGPRKTRRRQRKNSHLPPVIEIFLLLLLLSCDMTQLSCSPISHFVSIVPLLTAPSFPTISITI
ncbi:hypothetical protein J6590_041650 [Homalodisca vitripennis]|nr:hypothetical protein J6590_041650 [Homalodisca vitripennis]